MATRSVSILLGSALVLCALASTASAAATPECCMAEFWDRPGIERAHKLACERACPVEVAAAPAHGRLSHFAYDEDAQVARWRFRPDADAPVEDALTLRLQGPNGTSPSACRSTSPRASRTPRRSASRPPDGQGTVAFELSARFPAGRSGRGVVRLRRR